MRLDPGVLHVWRAHLDDLEWIGDSALSAVTLAKQKRRREISTAEPSVTALEAAPLMRPL